VEFCVRMNELAEGLRTARGQFRKKEPKATRFEEVKDKLVVIVCGEKAGSGFIVRDGGRPYLFTNAHVVQRGAVIAHRLDGTRLMLGPRDEAVGRDMVRFALDESLPAFDLAAGVPDIGDPAVVLGNSDGRGVVTEIRGKVIGVGPREIEVDAAFVIGNSGSPVLDRHGRVIGIATYLRDCRDDADWSKTNTRFNGIRRFALRLLGTRWARK
jgi:S1-C subfamily serine protease